MPDSNLDLFTESGATFSPCGLYRYRLWRYWGGSGYPKATFVMLNPSTADAVANDPTVERCEKRARMMGFGGLEVVNIFAFRETDPAVMKLQADPIGPENDKAILDAASDSDMIICAWGTHGEHRGRGREVFDMLSSNNIATQCLSTTLAGHPGHPLYIGYDVRPKPYPGYM